MEWLFGLLSYLLGEYTDSVIADRRRQRRAQGRQHERAWSTKAKIIGRSFRLQAGRGAQPDTVVGTRGAFAVTIALSDSATEIVVDGKGAIPESVTVDTSQSERVLTGDRAFDGRVHVAGDEAEVLALLTAEARARLADAVPSNGVEVHDGRLYCEETDEPEYVKTRVDALVELATCLRLRPADIPRRLAQNADSDPLPAVRVRNLTLLQQRFPGSRLARASSRRALASEDVEQQLTGAAFLGVEGLPAVRVTLASDQLPADLRVRALVHLVRHAPAPEVVETLERWKGLLGTCGRETALSLTGALERHGDAVESALLALLGHPASPVRLAAIEVLGRVGTVAAVEPLLGCRDELRPAARTAIAQIQARLGAVEAGRLSVAAPAEASGGLTAAEPDMAGGVSLAGESSETSPPTGLRANEAPKGDTGSRPPPREPA